MKFPRILQKRKVTMPHEHTHQSGQASHNPGQSSSQQNPSEPLGPEPWQGTELALEQLEARFHQIQGAIEPLRPDIVDKATNEGLYIVSLLKQWWQSLPPGAVTPARRKQPPQPAMRDPKSVA